MFRYASKRCLTTSCFLCSIFTKFLDLVMNFSKWMEWCNVEGCNRLIHVFSWWGNVRNVKSFRCEIIYSDGNWWKEVNKFCVFFYIYPKNCWFRPWNADHKIEKYELSFRLIKDLIKRSLQKKYWIYTEYFEMFLLFI